MKKIKNKWFISLFALVVLACAKEQPIDNPELMPQAIQFAATTDRSAYLGTKAPVPFPNGGKLSIIADTLYNDWTNPRINDVEVVTTDVGPTYNFNWRAGETQYWPLDGTALQLFAYCPKNASVIQPLNGNLNIVLPSNASTMPDLIYSTVQHGSKVNPNINFGTLQHALSQLTVVLITNGVGNPIYLNQFSIITRKNAALSMNTQALTVSTVTNITYSYPSNIPLVDGTTYKLESAPGIPFFVYPDVPNIDNTSIYLRFTDGPSNTLDIETTIKVSQFLTAGGASVHLERGKSSVLTITVQDVRLLEMQLTGTIVDWVDNGSFGITIE